jgi:hypothetical protein
MLSLFAKHFLPTFVHNDENGHVAPLCCGITTAGASGVQWGMQATVVPFHRAQLDDI